MEKLQRFGGAMMPPVMLMPFAGIMIGSLVKVWPWQHQIGDVSRPVLPHHPDLEPLFSGHIGLAVTFALIGVALVLVLELTAARMQKKREQEKVISD